MEKCKKEFEHDRHLCQLVATNEPLDSIKEMVRNPTHICLNCRRVSNDCSNLCNPEEL